MGLDYFTDCTVLVTGASSGIGREFALQLAPYAANIILAARRLDRLDSLKSEIQALYPAVNVFPYGIDLADETALDTFVEWLNETGLTVDFLINNAGLGDHGPFEDSDWRRVRQMLNVNVGALTKLTHRLLPGMKRNEGGAILNVSSVVSLLPLPYMAVYAATKAYVTSFSEGLRAELRGTGVSVTALCPGPVPTEFGEQAARENTETPLEVKAPEFMHIDAQTVAWEGLNAVVKDRARVVPGWGMFLATVLLGLIPFFILRFFLNARAREIRENQDL
ncbi:MAG TPA: SDR family oxidoreductase [Chthoniobacterales bacterium]